MPRLRALLPFRRRICSTGRVVACLDIVSRRSIGCSGPTLAFRCSTLPSAPPAAPPPPFHDSSHVVCRCRRVGGTWRHIDRRVRCVFASTGNRLGCFVGRPVGSFEQLLFPAFLSRGLRRLSALTPVFRHVRGRHGGRYDRVPIEDHARILALQNPLDLFIEGLSSDPDARRSAVPVQHL